MTDYKGWHPLGRQLLIEQEAPPSESPGGLALPAQLPEAKGLVLATGPRVDAAIPLGATVVYKPYASTEIRIGESDFLLVDARDVLAWRPPSRPR